MTDKAILLEPADLTEAVFTALKEKAELPVASMIILGMLAGAYVGLGGMFATVALAGADGLPFGVGQVLAGLVFTVGLALVLIAGAELFTGNTLMAGPVAARRLPFLTALRALAIVYCANFIGSLLLAALVFMAGVHEAGEGAVGLAALQIGAAKTGQGIMATLASGILANMLVCLAVWLAYAGNTVTEKLFGLLLPIAAFVAAGLEHSVANMYLLPYAFLVQGTGVEGGAFFSVADIARNLVPTTIGNIIGGALVALGYGYVYVMSK